MELNFEIDDSPVINATRVASNLKKGSWKKKRLDAKRIVQRVKKEQRGDVATRGVSVEKDSNTTNTQPTTAVQQPKAKQVTSSEVKQQVKPGFSSSIFTANPTIPKPVVKTTVEVTETRLFSDGTFTSLGLHPLLSKHLSEKLSIVKPTSIQEKSIPALLSTSTDIIIQAQTGSGKTLSFLLPILHHMITSSAANPEKEYYSRKSGTFGIILVPTRELAQQISQVLGKLLSYNTSDVDTKHRHWIVSSLLTGGESKKSEKARLRKGVTLLVCTPGRLLDHLKTTESFKVGELKWLVMDEADHLLEMGFEETLNEILSILNSRSKASGNTRQTILCSATIEKGIQKLAQEQLNDPQFIKVESDSKEEEQVRDGKKDEKEEQLIQVPQNLKQFYVMSPAKLRLVNLIGLLRKITKEKSKAIVFLSTGDSVDWHFDTFCKVETIATTGKGKNSKAKEDLPELDGETTKPDPAVEKNDYTDLQKLKQGFSSILFSNVKLFKLHGSLTHPQRQAIYSGFTQTTDPCVLFCTDVAARGLDVPDVTHIIQYDPPADVRDYIHRIGRTARLGTFGFSYIFLLPCESDYLELLAEYHCTLDEQKMEELLKQLESLTEQKKTKHKSFEVAASDVHMSLERLINDTPTGTENAQKAFQSFVRAYTTHIASEKHIFHIKKLHLGHLAKSFCLREAPQQIQSKYGGPKEKKEFTAKDMKRKATEMIKDAMVSEFADGGEVVLKRRR